MGALDAGHADRAGHAGTADAAVAVRVLREVLLVVVLGVVEGPLGLEPTFELFGSIVAGLALVAAGMAWRTRPQPKAVSACPATSAAGA